MAAPVSPSESPHPPATPVEFPLPAAVNNVLKVLLQGSAKRKGMGDEESVQPSDYVDYGRRFARLGEPFADIVDIVELGLEFENRDTDDEADVSDDAKSRQLLGDWHILCKVVLTFREEVIALAEQRRLRHGICMQINQGADKARGDDTGSIKGRILGYLHEDISLPLIPLIHQSDPNKLLRGWRHQTTARLITPVELEANDVTFADVLSGRIKVRANQMPRFLFPDSWRFNEDSLEDGLFRGHLILRVAKHIYRGPGSVFQPAGFRRGGRRPIGDIIKMRAMTPRSLAYVAVQTRFAISDVPQWHNIDRDFRYDAFFWNLVELLDSEEGKEILLFYDREVLGLPDEGYIDDAPQGPPSTLELIKTQRAEKRARLAAGETS